MSLTVFNGLTIIILSCLIVFLCFGIFSPLCFDLLSGTWTKPQRLKLVYKQEGWSGTQSGGVPSLRSGLREESPPLPSLVSHSPASLPPVSRGPAPCPGIPWEPTWDSGLPGPLCTPHSEGQSRSRWRGSGGGALRLDSPLEALAVLVGCGGGYTEQDRRPHFYRNRLVRFTPHFAFIRKNES